MLAGVRLWEKWSNIPESNAQTPHGLGLEAVCLGGASPVAQVKVGPKGVEVVGHRGGECICRLSIDFLRCLSDHIAVEERQRLADSHGHNDEGDEQEGVDT